MGSWHRARRGSSGIAALALLLTSCGLSGPDPGTPGAAVAETAGEQTESSLAEVALASVHRELPPPPVIADDRVTVVVTHAGGARAPGLDAAVAALRQRPDLHVVVVVPDGASPSVTTTMSGDPVQTVPGELVDAVESLGQPGGVDADLVVIGVEAGGASDLRASAAAARVAAGRGIPALQVSVERADGADYAAATMQLLEVLDFGLAGIVESPPQALRLLVPSCRTGTLRGRIDVGTATDEVPHELASDCLAAEPPPGADEDEAFSAGYATLAALG